MVFIGVAIVFGYLFLQDRQAKATTAGTLQTADQYGTLKYGVICGGLGAEVLVVLWMVKMRLVERPPKPKLLKVGVVEPGQKGKKPKLLKIRAAEPARKGKEPKLVKLRAVGLTPAEKERRIKKIIDSLWAKRGEASMDEIVNAAAKQGIDKRDVEKFLEHEKKRGRLGMSKS